MSEQEQQSDQPTPSPEDKRYNIIIAGLMMVIIITLSGLWIVEWGRRRRAEDDLAGYVAQQQQLQQLTGMLPKGDSMQQLFRNFEEKNTVKLPERAALEKTEWNGSGRQVLILDCKTAEILGFRPGDVIWVRPPAPETSPAGNG